MPDLDKLSGSARYQQLGLTIGVDVDLPESYVPTSTDEFTLSRSE